ncbi:hypothetical protein O181_064922 [Austropuccinia psidii MF-1]|uniref:Tc1-like transposase DDE domain-containing protein n=1 Tax=Austropuccinia psidii MF-1 TaxID=1389203 RepID=A0A9Q3I2U4_9BASI|nr:hypothetical protein [Austropuccinia psidii MF-1]
MIIGSYQEESLATIASLFPNLPIHLQLKSQQEPSNERYTNLASSPTSGRKTFKDDWRFLMNTDTGGSLIGLELFGPTSCRSSLARILSGTCRRSVMVWGAFCGGTKGPLVILQGQQTATDLVSNVYQPALQPFVKHMEWAPYVLGCQQLTLMEDGAPIHTA